MSIPLTKTRTDYAKQYDVHPRTITRWIAKGYPLDEPEKVRALEAAHKSTAKLRAQVAAIELGDVPLTAEELSNPPDLAHAMLFERILRCRRLGHELREAKKNTIPVEEVRAGVERVQNAVKTVLLALPGRARELAGCPPEQIQQRTAAWVHEALTTLSNPRSALYGS